MPAFTMEATLFTADEASFSELVELWQREIMREGVKRFLRAVVARIPVRTGFLRGAFTDVRREFGALGEDLTMTAPLKARRKGLREYYYYGKGARVLKTPTSGIPFATPPGEVLTFTDNVATFFLDVAISYYRINDNFAKIRGAPWNSLIEGGSVLADWIGRAVDRFPDISQVLARQTILMNGTRIIVGVTPPEVRASRFLTITGS